VAVHAGLRSRNVRVGRLFDSSVAVAAIHSELVDVQGMIEGNWLSRLIPDPGVFGRKVICHTGNHTGSHHRDADQDFDREPVGPSWENVGHEV
jgi:hypothetical protein